MPPSTDPILIIGTERSGSNLLRLMLDAHPAIAVPHPPHLLRYFAPILSTYGDLAVEANWHLLVADVARLVAWHIHPWPCGVDLDRLRREAVPRDLVSLQHALYEQYREHTGKRRWGCKSTFNVDHVAALRARFPGARFVLLVRDPRDVAASSKRSVFNPGHPWLTARLWRRQQETGLAWSDRLGPEVVHLLRYEDLLADPAGRLATLCRFLGEPFAAAMLEHASTAEAQRGAALSASWANNARPVLAGNAGKHARELSREEQRLVEGETFALMTRLGYEPRFAAGPLPPPGPLARAGIAARDLQLRFAVEARALARDRNVLLRWRRDLYVRLLAARGAPPTGGRR